MKKTPVLVRDIPPGEEAKCVSEGYAPDASLVRDIPLETAKNIREGHAPDLNP